MRKLKLDKINVVDLESTCWENKVPPDGMVSEIIEIGICVVDTTTLTQVEKRSILIRPTLSEISTFCTTLTSITSDLIEQEGIPFQTACNILLNDFDSKNRAWVSWGDYDRAMLYEQSKNLSIDYPFNKSHINLKPIFSLAYNLQKELGMTRALEKAKIELKGIHHRGVDDAYDTAELLINIFKKLRANNL